MPSTAPATRRARRARTSRSKAWGAVGVIGELLLTAGVVVGLYIVWQLWWTDLQGFQRQDDAVAAITEAFAGPSEDVGDPRTDEPPDFAAVDATLPDGMVAIGTIHFPTWGGAELPLLEGVTPDVMDFGAVGHYPSTVMPGEVGNFAAAGHRQTHGSPLGRIARLEEGDPVVVETANAYFVYRVTGSEIVLPTETDVLAPVPRNRGAEPTERLMTLTTCHPFNYSTHRWITYFELDHWVDRADGVPVELTEGA
ncbi:MAG: class E sortase [Actinomycetaceae bacterium]